MPILSKAQLRKQRKAHSGESDWDSLDSEDEITGTIHNLTLSIPAPAKQVTIPSIQSMTTPTRLFIASIGNPAPYTNTLHSAGHIVLSTIQKFYNFSPFVKSRPHANGLLSNNSSTPYTFWQSPAYMNVSGVALSTAYKTFTNEHSRDGAVKLVVLHDELELSPGKINVKNGSNSARGHNGLKSIKERMQGVEYTRIGVGIGRPQGREPQVVADYVLRKMSPAERARIEGCAAAVVLELKRLAG